MTLPSRSMWRSSLLLSVCALAACDSGGRSEPPVTAASRLLVTTSTTVIEPATTAPPAVDLSGLGARRIEANYRVTTPADETFSFDVVSWRDGAAGEASVAVAHVKDGDVMPVSNTSLAEVGIVPQGNGLVADGDWLEANGDGFARLTLQGRITRDQVLAVSAGEEGIILIEVDIGERGPINREPSEPVTPVASTQTIYSSNSCRFGLPTIAVSGDRTSIVCYEGDRASDELPQRYELRLQHDAATNVVTGGGSIETSEDTGYWRDHEVAALYNVLAVVRSEATGVRVRLSFDRGASFAQEVELPIGAVQSRLVQTAMAADYSLAVVCWRPREDQSSLDLVLVEGRPLAFDATGSPTWFTFDDPQVVHTVSINSTPLTTGIAWSEGGDLVVAYGASWFTSGFPAPTWTSTTEFRCATRLYGEQMRDRLVDREEIIGMDPTVSVLGQGDSLRIFYSYEGRAGIRVAQSDDGGDTFELTPAFGQPGDHLPAVFAREINGAVRIDVLYLAAREQGLELHQSRWIAWPNSPREDFALTNAIMVPSTQQQQPSGFMWPGLGYRTTQVNWFGFDAVLDGDQIVAVYDEATLDWSYMWFGGPFAGTMTAGGGIFASPNFQPATPPPLAPGLTEPVPAVDASHRHQLVLLRID